MVQYTTTILKFDKQGDKTGWTYIEVPEKIALQLKPGNKKAFRVKGCLDAFSFEGLSLIPMGGGNFILALNAIIRKGIGKTKGALVKVQLTVDKTPVLPPPELLECLADEPAALEHFNSFAKSHQNYFTKWIESAKTDETKAKRIAQAVTALCHKMDFGAMIRAAQKKRKELLG
jgi:hypothetical protein